MPIFYEVIDEEASASDSVTAQRGSQRDEIRAAGQEFHAKCVRPGGSENGIGCIDSWPELFASFAHDAILNVSPHWGGGDSCLGAASRDTSVPPM